jgi:hypothetical protein
MEAKTYTYTASTNTLKQVATMEKPEGPFEILGNVPDVYFLNAMRRTREYNAHLASLKEIPCEPGCKEVWKDGQEVVEGKDFEVHTICNSKRYDCRKVERCGYCELLAVPIKAEIEDEQALWRDVYAEAEAAIDWQYQEINDKKLIKILSERYTISKKK